MTWCCDGSESQRREMLPPLAVGRSPTQIQCPLPAASVDGFHPRPQSHISLSFPLPKHPFHSLLLNLILHPLSLSFVPSPPPHSNCVVEITGCGVLEDAVGVCQCLHYVLLYRSVSSASYLLLFRPQIRRFAVHRWILSTLT